MSIFFAFITMLFVGQGQSPQSVQADTISTPELYRSVSVTVVPDSVRTQILIGKRWHTISPQALLQQGEAQQQAEVEIPDTVHVWTYSTPVAFSVSETDSTLRWENYLNIFDRFYKQKGATTYSMGTVGRVDGLELYTFESRHLHLEMEGVQLNDPLTDAVNWNRLPVHKISEMAESNTGATYKSKVSLRDHYLVEPRTYLNFDESKFNNRSLEFSYTQNFKKGTNLELSFWDRRDGGGYSRQEVNGRQVVAKVYHQLSHNWLLKTALINNGVERQEPFGYSVTDPLGFTFNRFVEIPVESMATSNQTSTDIYVQLHHRADTTKQVSSVMGLHYQTDNWDLTYSADTLATSFKRAELFARQHLQLGTSTNISGTGRLFILGEKEGGQLTETSWAGGVAEVSLEQQFTRYIHLKGIGGVTAFSDGRQTTELSARVSLLPLPWVTISGFGGILSDAPDIQSLYWQSEEFSGNPDLPNEESFTIGVETELSLSEYLTLGLRGDFRESKQAAFLDTSSQFTAIDPYSTITGTAWVAFDSQRFEGEISSTWRSFSSSGTNDVNMLLDNSGDRLRIKSRLFWKNYVFDRAAFVKAGVIGHVAPYNERAAEFIAPLNRWQHGTQSFVNPSHYRMDVEVSARIRWFMMVLGWENVLDRVGQPGYFESVGYPMPGRRFKFGIRVLFTN